MKRLFASLTLTWLTLISNSALAADKPTSEAITIWSQGVRVAGNLWTPPGVEEGKKLPGILLVHGWGGVKSHLNEAYAPQFAKHGFYVLTFDYRGWGESDSRLITSEKQGEPDKDGNITVKAGRVREIVDPLDQLEDIDAALAYLMGEPGVDASRLGIWGSSFGGGLATVTAARNTNISVVVSQIGAVNNKASYKSVPGEFVQQAAIARARGAMDAMPPKEWGAPGLRGIPDLIAMKKYDPLVEAKTLTGAVLIIDAQNEELFDIKQQGGLLYEAIKDQATAKYMTLPGKHYDLYSGPSYMRALQEEEDWFVKYLTAE